MALADDDRTRAEGELNEAAARLASECGAPLKVTVDWASAAKVPGRDASQAGYYCKSAVEGLSSLCADPTGKEVLSQYVSTVSCRVEAGASKKSESGGPLLALNGTELAVVFDWDSSNLADAQRWARTKMVTPGPNGPVTIEARAEKKDGERQFAEAVTAFQQRCGAIKVSYDFASERGNDARPAWQGYLYCRSVLNGLGTACESEGKKPVAAKRLGEIQCRFEAGASKRKDLDPEYGGAAHVLKGKTLAVSYDWASSNLETAAQKWLRKLK